MGETIGDYVAQVTAAVQHPANDVVVAGTALKLLDTCFEVFARNNHRSTLDLAVKHWATDVASPTVMQTATRLFGNHEWVNRAVAYLRSLHSDAGNGLTRFRQALQDNAIIPGPAIVEDTQPRQLAETPLDAHQAPRGSTYAYSIVWQPFSADSDLGRKLGLKQTTALPYALHGIESANLEAGRGVQLNGRGLVLGILQAADRAPSFLHCEPATPEQMRCALSLIAQDLGEPDEDALATNASAYLGARYGNPHAVEALRNATRIIDDAALSMGDLVTGLFNEADARPDERAALLDEAVTAYAKWLQRSPLRSDNAQAVAYCGVAALIYLGRDTLVPFAHIALQPIMSKSAWLRVALNNLHAVPAGDWIAVSAPIKAATAAA
jgi:hypothetical protein